MKVTQSCLTLCDPMDCTFHGILQARILEWIAFAFYRGSSQPRDPTQVSHIASRFFTNWATRKPKNTGVGIAGGFFTNWATREAMRNIYKCSNYHTTALISHVSKVMLKTLQARLKQYVNREFPDVQPGFRKGRRTRDQIANIHWIIEKAREFKEKKNLLLLHWLH